MPEEINMEARMKAEVHRRAQWKGAIEQELQATVQEAADVRKKITEAKTSYKKQFYGKKFSKMQSKVMQMVSALQQFEAQTAPQQVAPHVHDENCDHGEEETNAETTESPTS